MKVHMDTCWIVLLTILIPCIRTLYIPSRGMKTLDADLSADLHELDTLEYYGNDFKTHIVNTNDVDDVKHLLEESLQKHHKTNSPNSQLNNEAESDDTKEKIINDKDSTMVSTTTTAKRKFKAAVILLSTFISGKTKKYIVLHKGKREVVTEPPKVEKVFGWWGG